MARARGFLDHSGAILGTATALAVAAILIAQAAQTAPIMDVHEGLTAGFAKALVAGYALAVAAVAGLAIVLPRRLLWLPVAGAGALAGTSLLATLTLGAEAWSFALALLTMSACWRLGRWVLVRMGAPSVASAPPAAWLMGALALGLALLVLGRLGLTRWWTVGIAVIALGLSGLWAAAPVLLAGLRGRRERIDRPTAAAAGIGLVLLALAAVFAAAPELMYDALYAKAWLPEEWARRGSVELFEIHPHLAVTGFAPLLALPGHLVGADGVGRYMQLLAAVGIVASVWWLGRRTPWAPFAAGAVAITPHLFWQSTNAYDDALLALAAVGLTAGALRVAAASSAVTPFVAGLVAGALAGACADFKLHLVPLAAGMVAGVVIFRPGAGRLRVAAGAVAGGLAAAAPPLLLRWIELGNPLLPNYNSTFRSDLWPTSGADLHFTTTRPGEDAGSILDRAGDVFEVIGRTVTRTQSLDGPSPDGSYGLLVAAIVVAALLLWTRARGDRRPLLLTVALAVAAVGWYEEFRVLRFILPIGVVAVAALAVAAPRRPLPALAQRGAIAVLAVAAVLLWPPTVGQFWNVPGRDLPWDAAIGVRGDYDYERASMLERDALAAYDSLAPPGALAMTTAHQRLWLTDGRDLAPDWEILERLRSASALPESVPLYDRVRDLGVGWMLGPREEGPDRHEGFREMVAEHGEPAWADQDWVLMRLVDRPRPPGLVPPCDEELEGRPGCWQGLAGGAGYSGEERPEGIVRVVPVCPGRTLTVNVRSRGRGGPVRVEVDYDGPDPVRGHMRAEGAAGDPFTVPATAPAGSRRGAQVRVIAPPHVVVERVAFGTYGGCRSDLQPDAG